jgi:hypothetical protein
MRSRVTAWALVVALSACGQGHGGERDDAEQPQQSFLHRLKPVGGWCPDTGGLLRWWGADCLPRYEAPDDYCRKPLPRTCWPGYSSFYRWEPPATPQSNGVGGGNQPQRER